MEQIPTELLNQPFAEWQLNLLTLFVIVQVLGRGYAALKRGGGLVGIWKGIVFGTNTPDDEK